MVHSVSSCLPLYTLAHQYIIHVFSMPRVSPISCCLLPPVPSPHPSTASHLISSCTHAHPHPSPLNAPCSAKNRTSSAKGLFLRRPRFYVEIMIVQRDLCCVPRPWPLYFLSSRTRIAGCLVRVLELASHSYCSLSRNPTTPQAPKASPPRCKSTPRPKIARRPRKVSLR